MLQASKHPASQQEGMSPSDVTQGQILSAHLTGCAVGEALAKAECVVDMVDVAPTDAKVRLKPTLPNFTLKGQIRTNTKSTMCM
jgi:hypothetical protein